MTERKNYTASELLAVMSARILKDGQIVFAGVGIPLLAGRDPTPSANGGFDVLVSESLARAVAPEGDAVGSAFRFSRDGQPHRVAGVVPDVKWRGPASPFSDEAIIYLTEQRRDGGAARSACV